ncbi:hypothetical protein L2E82_13592 [Cichorium intybus]|uniref:Uncharacterized protein n=1 Tax=Cichorium intybus TaxID=13427 RepID=A0ACB9EYW6_CICIN|nr:hypothetical protein L2E82_13592 [Cichorium intybus]
MDRKIVSHTADKTQRLSKDIGKGRYGGTYRSHHSANRAWWWPTVMVFRSFSPLSPQSSYISSSPFSSSTWNDFPIHTLKNQYPLVNGRFPVLPLFHGEDLVQQVRALPTQLILPSGLNRLIFGPRIISISKIIAFTRTSATRCQTLTVAAQKIKVIFSDFILIKFLLSTANDVSPALLTCTPLIGNSLARVLPMEKDNMQNTF